MATKRIPRGVQSHQELRANTSARDLRTHTEKFRHFIEKGDGVVLMTMMAVGAMWFWPQAMEYTFFAAMGFLFWASRQHFVLPFRMPKTSGRLDYNDPPPGSSGPGPAQGIAFLGNDMSTGKELWLNKSDVCTHFLIFGSTGAGKALKDDAKVYTPTGWRQMSELVVGDQVMSPTGVPAKVEGVYPQGSLELWEMLLEDGRRLDISADHLWSVAFGGVESPWVQSAPLAWEVLSTEDIHARLTAPGAPATSAWLPVCQFAVELPAAERTRLSAWSKAAYGAWQENAPWPVLAPEDYVHAGYLLRQLRQHVKAQPQGRLWRWPAPPPALRDCFLQLVWAAGGKVEPLAESQDVKPVHWDIWDQTQGIKIARLRPAGRQASCRCIKIDRPDGLFVIQDFLVTHNTETLLSLAFNALVHGSGFIYVDGKGDNSLWSKVFSLVRSVGRDDDLLVINYMTGGQDIIGAQSTKRSNTLNPFIAGSASGLTELLVSLMDEAGGDNAMWKGRAMSLISGLMFMLVYMRENEGLLLDVEVIRDSLTLENIQKLTKRRDLPTQVLQPLVAYLRSLPGYQESAPKQSETVLDQHGYLQMQFTKILGSLSDTYGFIFKTNLGEVDFFDVVVNRRILLVLLPALEKSPDELGNLGKIIVASLRQMMATGLGDALEGDYEDVIETKPTASLSPFMCILDEYGYYVVKGASVMPAQARSLGFSMVFAGQDYPAFQKNNNKEEAVSTIGNCNIKIFMKVEDPADTFELFKQSVGEAEVSKTSGFQYNNGIIGSYNDQMNANLERRSRGDLLDLKDQREGEAHIIFKSTLVRAVMFYANPSKVKKLRLNHFLRVEPPLAQDMQKMLRLREELASRMVSPEAMEQCRERAGSPVRILASSQVLRAQTQAGQSPVMAGMAGIIALHRLNQSKTEQFGEMGAQMKEALRQDRPRLNIFTEPGDVDLLQDLPDDFDDMEEEAPSFEDHEISLDGPETRNRLSDLEAAGGLSAAAAAARAAHTASEMEILSAYPQNPPEPMEPDELMSILEGLQDELSDQQEDDET